MPHTTHLFPKREGERVPDVSLRVRRNGDWAMLTSADLSPEPVPAPWAEITDRTGEIVPQSGSEQSMSIMKKLTEG